MLSEHSSHFFFFFLLLVLFELELDGCKLIFNVLLFSLVTVVSLLVLGPLSSLRLDFKLVVVALGVTTVILVKSPVESGLVTVPDSMFSNFFF